MVEVKEFNGELCVRGLAHFKYWPLEDQIQNLFELVWLGFEELSKDINTFIVLLEVIGEQLGLEIGSEDLLNLNLQFLNLVSLDFIESPFVLLVYHCPLIFLPKDYIESPTALFLYLLLLELGGLRLSWTDSPNLSSIFRLRSVLSLGGLLFWHLFPLKSSFLESRLRLLLGRGFFFRGDNSSSRTKSFL